MSKSEKQHLYIHVYIYTHIYLYIRTCKRIKSISNENNYSISIIYVVFNSFIAIGNFTEVLRKFASRIRYRDHDLTQQ